MIFEDQLNPVQKSICTHYLLFYQVVPDAVVNTPRKWRLFLFKERIYFTKLSVWNDYKNSRNYFDHLKRSNVNVNKYPFECVPIAIHSGQSQRNIEMNTC